MASWKSPVVQRLLFSKNIRLLNFVRADTYVALYPFLSKVGGARRVGGPGPKSST